VRSTAAALLCAVVLACAGCGSADDNVGPRVIPTGKPPVPTGATEVSHGPPPLRDPNYCDPTASLRPRGPLPSPGEMPSNSTMNVIHSVGALNVAVDEDTYKFGFRDPLTGSLEGFDIDLARAIATAIFGDADHLRLTVLHTNEWASALQMLRVDMVIRTIPITCAGRADAEFSTVYYQARQRVLVRAGSGHTGLDSLGGKRVCAAEGTTALRYIRHAESRPVAVRVPAWSDCLVMLQQNQVAAVAATDAILAGLAAQDPYTEVVGTSSTTEPYGIAIANENQDLVRFVNAVLERMRTDGSWARLYDKWLSDELGPTPKPPQARYAD
jgi:polar amino acid transport system substrate-binding protein